MSKSPVQFVDDEEEESTTQQKANQSKSRIQESDERTPDSLNELNNYHQMSLPSQGYLGYPSVIEYRDVVYGDEIKIKMATQDTYIKTVNKVLKGILNNPSFYDDMAIVDRDYALLWTFANSYSPKQQMEMQCIKCEHVNDVTVNLTELEVDDINPEIPVPFEMELKNGEIIYVHLPRVKDELIADSMIKDEDNDSSFDDYILQSTIDVASKTFKTNQKKFEWIAENISAKEIRIIKQFYERFTFGVNDIIERECENCGELNRGRFPFQLDNFFANSGSEDDLEYYLQLNKKRSSE